MATEGNHRSLTAGVSLPQWMKSKIHENKFDLDQSTFSPTEIDDTLMYIQLARAESESTQKLNNSVNLVDKVSDANSVYGNKPDFSKHTIHCQKFITENATNLAQQIKHPTAAAATTTTKVKSNGTDDGFKGEAAACGSSVVRVAHQMVSGKVVRGFNIEPRDSECPQGFDPTLRRGSKSLPSSPLTSPNSSPKSRRKIHNKYFTGAFVDSGKYQGSWILSSLLGKREMSQSVGFIAEEEPIHTDLQKKISAMSIDDVSEQKSFNKQVFKAKPSELREMNFWTPTSM